ncbi:pyridoxamine 5'-phosphate oxidase family protein [Methylobacterium sp. E-045]|uniref:pyridoxamine 5'-phosphate oxidase family protein n=1 Tax=Methylobacterium sp. E-045 TaxID=2836575 RepID=UPI001FBB0996|nr:pyridoxamine 5'-phosphate oxidase family protein [Methylobacterium sp. E-045]MCJ2131076.1 pyridoxamine 5'-phosphate oxidase family protein [Methylobacterium sp. E-045]
MTPLPAFYDDLDASLAHLWRLLEDGPALRRNAFHMPALATVDEAGAPQVRTVVLREADAEAGSMRFHCDRRSRKAAEIAASGRAALHGYDSASKVQIRVSGTAMLHTDDALADAAWAGSLAMSLVCYGVAPEPGAELASGDAYSLPETDAGIAAGRLNFCAVLVSATRLEFLFLDRRGHRRAAWTRNGDGWAGTWLAP